MQRSDFSYYLPEHLIAQYPPELRTGSRLLAMATTTGNYQDLPFIDFPSLLFPGDLLVFNDTKVMPARLFGQKPSGGKVEILVERFLDEHRVLAQLRARKTPKPQTLLYLEGGVTVVVLQRVEQFFELQFEETRSVEEILETIGHIPLPPYIKREDSPLDRSRYQTVYARQLGAVAAPTAGLHFDEAMLERIRAMGIEMTFVTLHVGAGTFAPMRVEDVCQHVMHAEFVKVSATVCEQVQAAQRRGGRVVAIGTTSVRALESASTAGEIKPFQGETRLFITPGYRFRSVDALCTNFHLPESTLLMLVCAFGGQEQVLAAYRHAVAQGYRFFSYGDAMFLSCQGV
jgi:S-adenosylmethionine:tRNA ribosyltransferase-isomerase